MSKDTKFKAEDIQKGEGKEVFGGDHVIVHYTGYLEDGTIFDSSHKRGEPFKTRIGVGQVIEGWDMGIVGMKKGGKRKLTIPSQLAYGDQEMGIIPPNSTLIFDVELVDIE